MSFISVEDPSVSEVRDIPWKVGKYKKQELSRGFRISFELPKLGDSEWKSLHNNNGVSGWLIRLRKKSNMRNEILGYFAVEMISPKPGSEFLYRVSSSDKASIGINYAASSISTRLDHLPCPAFDHRILIDEIEVTHRPVGRKLWVTSPADERTIGAKVNLISYSAVSVNGGMSLIGEYYIDLALYNPKQKLKKSSYIELANHVSLTKEENVVIKGCENFQVPDVEDHNPVKKFKFGN